MDCGPTQAPRQAVSLVSRAPTFAALAALLCAVQRVFLPPRASLGLRLFGPWTPPCSKAAGSFLHGTLLIRYALFCYMVARGVLASFCPHDRKASSAQALL